MCAEAAQSAEALVATRIKELRKELGLNQADFAANLGVSRGYVSDVENGRARVSVELLFAIQNTFYPHSARAAMFALLGDADMNAPAHDEAGPLAAVVGLDRRAMEAALARLEELETLEGKPFSPRTKARYIRHFMYVYVDQMQKALERGVGQDQARELASRACAEMNGDEA